MRKLGLCSSVVFLIAASNAFALTAALSQTGTGFTTIEVDYLTGMSGLDLSVDLSRLPEDPTIAGAQMNFVADAAGITIVGTVGSAGSSGTGTRYNSPEWDSNTTTGFAFSPNAFSGPMPPGTERGIYGSAYNDEDATWDTASSNMGHLVVNVAPGPNDSFIHLSPASFLGIDALTFEDIEGDELGVTIHYVPEPASVLLLLGALPFMRRRRTA